MNIAFFHSHKFRFDGTTYSSTGGLGIQVLSKYIGENDTMTVYARVIPAQRDEKLSKITDPRISVRSYAEVNLVDVIRNSDICIMRLPSPIGFKACKVARKLGKPYLVEVVGCAWDAYWNYGLKGKLVALPAYLIMRDCVKKSKYTMYVTQKFLQKRYPCDGESIGVSDVEMPPPDDEVLQKRLKRISEKKLKIVLATIGAVDVSYKGQDSVIRALAILKKQGHCHYEYRLIGGGNPERLRNLASECGVAEQVVFMGAKPHEEVFGALDATDVYIQPSRLEGLCRSLLEAMSRGCPAIASDVGGNGELVESVMLYKSGRNNEERIADLIERLSAPKIRSDYARRNFERAKEYDSQVLKKRWNEFYRAFIEAHTCNQRLI